MTGLDLFNKLSTYTLTELADTQIIVVPANGEEEELSSVAGYKFMGSDIIILQCKPYAGTPFNAR